VRPLIFCLPALLISAGCYTTQPLRNVELRRQVKRSEAALTLVDTDGSSVRLDPNTDLRFLLRTGEVTDWIEARDLWRSELGLSYETREGVFFVAWEEIVGVEVRNLSGGKTFALMLGVVAAVVVLVLAIASKSGGGGSGIGSGKKRSSGHAKRPVVRRRLPRPTRGGVHVHVPLAIVLAATHGPHPHDAPPPPPPPSTPPEALPAPAVAGGAEASPPESPAAPESAPAARLFEGSIRRTSQIEFVGHAEAGTELVRVEGYTGSLVLGLRIRETFEIGGGVRHVLAPLPPGRDDELDSGLVGFGRIGAHLWVDDRHWFALPLSIDAGAGYQVLYHLRLNCGLRYSPIRNLSIGLLPFNPSFVHFKEDSPFAGAMRWTFPTTLELGFVF
jgi:hypothetical protein